jgi:hypothetical protein
VLPYLTMKTTETDTPTPIPPKTLADAKDALQIACATGDLTSARYLHRIITREERLATSRIPYPRTPA